MSETAGLTDDAAARTIAPVRSALKIARTGFVFGFAATLGVVVAIVVLDVLFRWLH